MIYHLKVTRYVFFINWLDFIVLVFLGSESGISARAFVIFLYSTVPIQEASSF